MSQIEPIQALFRPQAQASQFDDREFGSVVHRIPSLMLFSTLSALLFMALLTVLMFTQYKETEQGRGIVESSGRVEQILSPSRARLQELHVREGDVVEAGQKLATLSQLVFDHEGRPITELARQQVQQRVLLLEQEAILRGQQAEQKQRSIRESLHSRMQRQEFLNTELVLLLEQLQISAGQMLALQTLLEQSAISQTSYDQQQLHHLDLQRQEHELQRSITRLTEEIASLREQELSLSSELALQQLQHQQQHQNLIFRHKELQQQDKTTLVAEQAGIVAGIAVEEGDSLQPGQTVFSIRDNQAGLQISTYVPSSVVGKLYQGQSMMVSFDAYKHLHYGRYPARITQISHASLDPRGQRLPVPGLAEPVFRVIAELDQDFVDGPQRYVLQSGLLLTADFITAEHSLFSFILKPVLELRGKVG